MLCGMTLLDDLITLDSRGIDLVAAAASSSAETLISRGMDPDRAVQLTTAAEVFFAPVRNRRAQTACVDAARDRGHRVDTLAFIARSSRSLTKDADRWKYRRALCETDGDLRTIMRAAKKLKKKLAPPTPRAPKASITYHDKGLSTLHVTGRTSDVLAAYHAARLDPAAWLTGDATTRVAAPAITTVLNMDIGNFAAWRTHPNNAAEIQVQLTNGEWLDGAELVNRKLDKAGYIALISPTDGPVNLYATTLAGDDPANPRRATRELRLLMSADGPTCAWADCHQPADVSEAHHLTEWASGGGTEIGNLCWLCTYHNRQNGRPGRGRMHRHRGRVTWQSPSGYRIPGGVDHADPDRREQRLAHTPATT